MARTPQPFSARRRDRGTDAVVVLSGEADLVAREEVTDALADAVGGSSSVLVDLRGLSFMDSTLIACLVRAKQEADAHGVRFGVVAGTGYAARLLRLVGLEDVLRAPQELDRPHPVRGSAPAG